MKNVVINVNNAGDFVKESFINGYLKSLQKLADWEVNGLDQDDDKAMKEWQDNYTVQIEMRGKVLGISPNTSLKNYNKVLQAKVNAMADPYGRPAEVIVQVG